MASLPEDGIVRIGLPHVHETGEDKYDPSQWRKCPTFVEHRFEKMKFSLTLPIILSALYIRGSFSLAQIDIPCAQYCGQVAGSEAGCDP